MYLPVEEGKVAHFFIWPTRIWSVKHGMISVGILILKIRMHIPLSVPRVNTNESPKVLDLVSE